MREGRTNAYKLQPPLFLLSLIPIKVPYAAVIILIPVFAIYIWLKAPSNNE